MLAFTQFANKQTKYELNMSKVETKYELNREKVGLRVVDILEEIQLLFKQFYRISFNKRRQEFHWKTRNFLFDKIA